MKLWLVAALALACGVLLGGVAVSRVRSAASTKPSAQPVAELPPRWNDAQDSAHETGVVTAGYSDAEEPPRRLDDGEVPESPKHAAVREVIDRILRDATAEEREIWFDELKGLPPGIVEDLLNVRRQFGLAKPQTPAGFPPLAERSPAHPVPPPAELSQPSRWTEAIHAMQRAREIHLHNLANAYSPGYRRLEPQFTQLGPPGESSSDPVGSRWHGTRIDDRFNSPPERSNVDPDQEWREIERIDRWLNAVR